MIVHAEDSTAIERAPAPHGRHYSDFLASRPRGSENVAIAHLIEAARHTGASVHLLHLSSSDAVPMLRTARREGIRMTVETCPHYLVFEAEAIADGATQFKCCPPIREIGNREELWHALARGDIDCVVSDHSPCTAELKRLDVGRVRHRVGRHLVAADRAACRVDRGPAARVTRSSTWSGGWRSGPPRSPGCSTRAASSVGYHADFAVFAPDDAFVVDPTLLHHRNPVTPYAQRALAGVVRSTWLRGRRVTGDEPQGRLIARGEAC